MTESRYDLQRIEMAPYIPTDARSVLEVGCATGRFSRVLRDRLPEARLVGIDAEPSTADHSFDERIVGHFPDDVPAAEYDCVVFNDVLEHLVDPWATLRAARSYLADRGVIVASIPNVRHVRVLKPLLLRGEWEYTDVGLLDRTHLRFFTRSSMRELFETSGYEIERLEPINIMNRGRWGRVDKFTRGRLTDFLAMQYAVVAR